MAERLIVDLGSSRLAWRGPHGAGALWHAGEPGKRLLAAFGGEAAPGRGFVGSVARRETTEELLRACRSGWGLELVELVPGREACGVRNGYAQPERLGIDRWAGLVAAYRRWGGGVLVADCGTAVTVDYVDCAGRHRGGWIAPGLALMRSALGAGTRLAPAPEPPAAVAFGTDTDACVSGGIHAAAAGLLERARGQVAATGEGPRRLVLTGGAAPAIAALVGAPWEVEPELVLDGLELLAEAAA